MAVGNGATNGQTGATTPVPAVFGTAVAILAGGSVTSRELQGDGLAFLNVWVNKSAGVGAVTVVVEFAMGVDIGGGPLWHPLAAAIGPVVVGAPSLTNYRLGARRYRITISSSALGTATVTYRVTCTL